MFFLVRVPCGDHGTLGSTEAPGETPSRACCFRGVALGEATFCGVAICFGDGVFIFFVCKGDFEFKLGSADDLRGGVAALMETTRVLGRPVGESKCDC